MGLKAPLLIKAISENTPPDVRITKMVFEGPYLVLYTTSLSAVSGEIDMAVKIAKAIKRKVIIRPDESIRKPQDKVKNIILNKAPEGADIRYMYFNEKTGEAHIYALRPGHIIGRGGVTLWGLTKETGWKIVVHRAPAIRSQVMEKVNNFMYSDYNGRFKILSEMGNLLNRERIYESDWITVTPLGGFGEVGRSSILVETPNSKVIVDAGAKPGAKRLSEEFPAFYALGFDPEEIDAVILSHAHLDHSIAIPYLFKYGYRGPVYMTEPTLYLTMVLIEDYIKVAEREGRSPPYSMTDVSTMLAHTIALRYGEVVDISPDMKLALYNAGHILGSSIVHLHIGEGLHNIVYTSDFKYMNTRLLNRAFNNFKRVETLIMESTYGHSSDIMPNRSESEAMLKRIINETIEKGGKVLMPMLSVGRAQEILLVLYEALEKGEIPKVPVYIDGLIQETTAIHTAFIDMLSSDVRETVFKEGVMPFNAEYFNPLESRELRPEIVEGGPSIIVAPSGMLTGGPIIEYLKLLAYDEKSSIIFTSYQVPGTPGRRLIDGIREMYIGGEFIKVNLRVFNVEGFSGHSDRRQLLNYVNSLIKRTSGPKLVIIGHGEPTKSRSLAQTIRGRYKIPVVTPNILETVKVR